jgi:hypothetical protein
VRTICRVWRRHWATLQFGFNAFTRRMRLAAQAALDCLIDAIEGGHRKYQQIYSGTNESISHTSYLTTGWRKHRKTAEFSALAACILSTDVALRHQSRACTNATHVVKRKQHVIAWWCVVGRVVIGRISIAKQCRDNQDNDVV